MRQLSGPKKSAFNKAALTGTALLYCLMNFMLITAPIVLPSLDLAAAAAALQLNSSSRRLFASASEG